MLNLPNWEVQKVSQTEFDFQLTARSVLPPPLCPGCFQTAFVNFGTRDQLFMDFPQEGKRVGIAVVRQRYKCKGCGKVFQQPLPDMDDSHFATRRLVDYIKRESVRRTFVAIAEEVGLHEKTIRRIFSEYVQELEQTVRFATPEWMGLDEIFLLRPCGIVTNIRERTLVEMLKDRKQKTIETYLWGLSDRRQVKIVTMDMWAPYRLAVRSALPQAEITVDKFHVQRMANNVLETVRREVQATLDRKKRKTLKHERYLLLKRQKDLKVDEQLLLQTWTLNLPLLGQAYNLKESFFDIWEAKTKAQAIQRYSQWKREIPEVLTEHFRLITTAVRNWHTEVFSYFEHRVTNAFTESFNNLVRLANRIGRGYSWEVLRAKMLYSEGFRKQKKPKYWESPVFQEGMALYHALPHQLLQMEENFGVSLSTLVEKIEQGAI